MTTGLVLLALLSEPIGRGAAQDAARRELAKRIYHTDDPSLVERVIRLLRDWVVGLLADAARALPGGWPGLVALVIGVGVLVVAVRLGIGPAQRTRARAVLLGGTRQTAADHRAAADGHHARGAYADAIAERVRAIARDLDERAIIDALPGRTANELATAAAQAFGDLADRLRAAARLFDDVWYGDRPATAADDDELRDLDAQLRAARPDRPAPARSGT